MPKCFPASAIFMHQQAAKSRFSGNENCHSNGADFFPEIVTYSCGRMLGGRCRERADETFIKPCTGLECAIATDTEPLGWLTYTENGTCFLNVLVVKFAPCPP
jgi:hypothetical protein